MKNHWKIERDYQKFADRMNLVSLFAALAIVIYLS